MLGRKTKRAKTVVMGTPDEYLRMDVSEHADGLDGLNHAQGTENRHRGAAKSIAHFPRPIQRAGHPLVSHGHRWDLHQWDHCHLPPTQATGTWPSSTTILRIPSLRWRPLVQQNKRCFPYGASFGDHCSQGVGGLSNVPGGVSTKGGGGCTGPGVLPISVTQGSNPGPFARVVLDLWLIANAG